MTIRATRRVSDDNLSFERQFGKVIGRLDLVAEVATEKYRLAVIRYVLNCVGDIAC